MKKEDVLYPIGWDEKIMVQIYDEIFNDEIYKTFFDIKDGDVIVDFGANIGLFTLYALENANVEKIYMVEPLLMNYDYMIRNVIYNRKEDLHKLIFVKAGISKNGFTTIEEGDIGSKLGLGTEITKTFSFMKFIEFYKIDKIDILKIDIEGSEIKMFNDETFEWIFNHGVNRLMGEMHPIKKNGEVISNIFKRFLKNGYDIKIISVDGYDIKDNIINNNTLHDGVKAWDYYSEYLFYMKKR